MIERPAFAAKELAAGLGRDESTVRKALKTYGVLPCSVRCKQGGKSPVWRINQLPDAWQDELAQKAKDGSWKDSEHMLTKPREPWRPTIDGVAVTLREVAGHCVEEAQRRQRALLPSLHRLTGSSPVPPAEAEERGLAEWRAAFGRTASVHKWRRWINRVVDRDAGAQDFSRLELFLAEKLARQPRPASNDQPIGSGLWKLRSALACVGRPTSPTPQEQLYIWMRALDERRDLVEAGVLERAADRAVFDVLNSSGVRLARTPDALKKTFGRKLVRWQEGGCKPSALQDGRRVERTDLRLPLPDTDRELIIARAVEHGGRPRLARGAGSRRTFPTDRFPVYRQAGQQKLCAPRRA